MSDAPPQRIALLLPELEAGGAQRVMLLLAREFAARGHHVDLLVLRAAGALLPLVPPTVRFVDLGVQSCGLGPAGFALSAVYRLTKWLRHEKPAALLSTITGTNLVAILARTASRTPTQVVIREAVTLQNLVSPLRRRAMRLLYPLANGVVALTTVMGRQLVEEIGVPPRRIHCIPNPVDIDFVRAQAAASLSHPWLDDPDINVVISVGRLIPQKDYATLLRAFALLPAASVMRLIIVGEGPERPRLEALATELGIAERIHLPGFDSNPWRWMARANLFVLSSLWEGHPNALLEALVLGLPAIITEYDASAVDIAARLHLRSVPPNAPPALAGAMLAAPRAHPPTPPDSLAETVECYLSALR